MGDTIIPSALPEKPVPESLRGLSAWYLCDRHRAWWNIPIGAGLALFVVVLVLQKTFDNPAKRLPESRKAWLALAPQKIPDAQNAALDYASAQKARVAYSGPKEDDPIFGIGRHSADYLRLPHIQAYLSANQVALQWLLTASKKKHAFWNLKYVQGLGMMMPHLAELRSSARLLGLYARSQACLGQHEDAAEALRSLFFMTRHVGDDPVIISALVGVAMSQIAINSLELILQETPPLNHRDLQGYRNALWLNQQCINRLVRSLESEKKVAIYEFDRIAYGALSNENSMSIPLYGSERACLIAIMDEYIEKVKSGNLVFKEDEHFEALVRKHQQGSSIASEMFIPVLLACGTNFGKIQDRVRVADTALALLQFRIEKGRDPKALEEMVPEFLEKTHRDIFNHKPFRMRRDAQGILKKDSSEKLGQRYPGLIRIYSLGVNGKDDRGYNNWNEEWVTPQIEAPSESDDTVFCVPPLKATQGDRKNRQGKP